MNWRDTDFNVSGDEPIREQMQIHSRSNEHHIQASCGFNSHELRSRTRGLGCQAGIKLRISVVDRVQR
eukprot:3974789-Amphidinium_carterae.1